MPVFVITPPEAILTADDAKLWAPVLVSASDAQIDALIASAQAEIEPTLSWIGASFGAQTLELRLDGFPYAAREIKLPFPPVTAVTSVKYLDSDGALQTLSASAYTVAGLNSRTPRIVLKPDQVWPQTQEVPEAVLVRYAAGYDNPDDPQLKPARQALALMCAEIRSITMKDPTLRMEFIEGVVRRDYAVTKEAIGLTVSVAERLLSKYWVR